MKIKPTIYITRDLDSKSCLYSLQDKYTIKGFSLLEFEYIEVENIPTSVWYFFYSKNGVDSFYENANRLNFQFFPHHKIGVIGEGTASKFNSLFNKNVDYIADINKEQILPSYITDAKITFVQAEESILRFQDSLDSENRSCLITYRSIQKAISMPIKADFLIFTSPKNVHAYFKFNDFGTSSIYIAFGKSTKSALTLYNVKNIYVTKKASEKSILNLILEKFVI
jgi:uroporphyrinogen-III synthase